jgi:predicted TIM-barrel fold metal-dependent hydrolase
VKAGITTVCIHKGLLPKDYETSIPGGAWKYANVDDLPKAAKDWPQINFVIYHSALRAFLEPPDSELAEFEKSGYIRWVSDLASIPEKAGVSNVYADVGTSFAISAVSNPRFCAAMMGTLIKGLGHDHVFWGTDSAWYGSPQWQIEAFRRLEIPARARRRHSQERDLRLQRGALLQARSARRTPAHARGRDCEAEGCLYRGRPYAEQHRLWLCRPETAITSSSGGRSVPRL